MKNSRAAIRYAKSLLDLAKEQGKEDAVFNDMQLISNTINASSDLKAVLNSPVVKSDKKESILNSIFNEKVDAITLKFLSIVANKSRESLLPAIAKAYSSEYKASKLITEAEVTSATKLNTNDINEIAQLLNVNKNSIEITEKIDPSVIGGFIIRVGDKQIDATVKGKLLKLKQEFSSNSHRAISN